MSVNKYGERYFRIMPWILIGIIVSGFGLFQIRFSENVPSITGVYLVHALLVMSWFLMLVSQPRLIAAGRYDLHRKAGWASILLFIAIVVYAYLITVTAVGREGFSIAGNDPISSSIFPFFDIFAFAIAYTMGIVWRKHAAAHKRFMLLSGMLMMDAAVARVVLGTGLPEPLILLIELLLFASLLVYDKRSLGKVHWASMMGLLLWIVQVVAKMGFAKNEGWISFATRVFSI